MTNVECRTDIEGKNYRGTKSVTRSGKTCQRWDMHTPHEHAADDDPAEFGEIFMADVWNYCRSPYPNLGLMCFTIDPNVRWEECDVPMCGKLNISFIN